MSRQTAADRVGDIPLVDLAAQFGDIADVVLPRIVQLLGDGAFVGGAAVTDFESAYAQYCGVGQCVGVANGTDALEMALRACGVTPGGEVIVPANTFIATAEAVSRIGARPVLVDVDEQTQLMDPSCVSRVVGRRTQAVVPVHLYGQMAPVEKIEIEAPGIPIVEDAAQAQGARRFGRTAGSLGLAAGTSFYPGKNLGAAGDAGAVTTDDPTIARTVRMLGSHGSAVKYQHDIVGFNSRLDALQAVVLSAKLQHLERWNRARREAAACYDELLSGLDAVVLPRTSPGNQHVWHLYVVQVDDRDRVLRILQDAGIGAGIHYPVPVHLAGAYRSLGYTVGDFPVSEAAAGRALSLPLYPHIRPDQQARVAEVLAGALD